MCKNHGTRQRNQCLPCAKAKAHGKHLNFAMCHVYRHTAKAWPRHRSWVATFFCRGSIVAHGKPFAMCPIYSTRQRPALPIPGCRVCFAVCGTRQRVCRELLGLYRVPLAHGKGEVSRSASNSFGTLRWALTLYLQKKKLNVEDIIEDFIFFDELDVKLSIRIICSRIL